MTETFRLTLAQSNPVAGDIAGNARLALQAWEAGRDAGADMVALSEMFITGHPVRDLAAKPVFVAAAMDAVAALARDCAGGPVLGIGAPYARDGAIYNAYCLCENGAVTARVLKHVLSGGADADAARVYASAPISGPYRVGPLRIGTPIGEDALHEDVPEALAESGAEILLVPNGSPYHRQAFSIRVSHMVGRTVETGLPLVYLNMVGGQDDQVFDGGSFVLNPGGKLAHQLPVFDPAIRHVVFERQEAGWRATDGDKASLPDEWEQDYRAMVMGLGDYCAKTGVGTVLLGLSGGIESALVAAIAADALGPANLRCVTLPSEDTSQASRDAAAAIARSLGCRLDTVPVEEARRATAGALAPVVEGRASGATEATILSRLRGATLMAMSDTFGAMLVSAGDKSDMELGRATTHGDMAGGYNPIKDLSKTRVVETCRWRNANHRPWMRGPAGEVIAGGTIDPPPAGRTQADGLPPYATLDVILEELVDRDRSVAEIVAMGHDRDMVERIEGLVYASEHQRHRSAPGPQLTARAYWRDRRYPIAHRWRDRG